MGAYSRKYNTRAVFSAQSIPPIFTQKHSLEGSIKQEMEKKDRTFVL